MTFDLKKRRVELKLSQEQVADIVGVTKATVSKWEKGEIENMKRDKIAKLSEVLKISPLIIMGYQNVTEGIKRSIPVLGTIACGDPITAETNIDEYREELEESLPSGELFYLKTKGDSMSPTVPPNSYILIREQASVEDGEIAAVLLNGDEEATLKRVKYQEGIVMLTADNPKYAPYIVNENNPARILGKAVKVSFDL